MRARKLTNPGSKSPERVQRLVMVGPVGVKVGSQDKLDIPDIFALPQADVQKLLYHDPGTPPLFGSAEYSSLNKLVAPDCGSGWRSTSYE